MKVLITGGYGFIGSHIADKFHREGYSIFIIDNLTKGKKDNVAHKHRFYELSVEDPKCEEVFKSNTFDVIVHLASQTEDAYSQKNSYYDTKVNILGLVNMLSLATKYKAKKFIFASSASVYGNNCEHICSEDSSKAPISISATNKLLGESYCKVWKSLFNLETVSLRLSNVYGPRQDVEDGGVIARFIGNYCNGKGITIYGDGEQLRDFLYVEDVADAIYKASVIKYSGVLNLSTGIGTSINHLVSLIERSKEFKSVQHVERRVGDVRNSKLDNTMIMKVYDWIPMTKLEEGIKKTHVYTSRMLSNDKKTTSPTKEKAKKFFKRTKRKNIDFNERKWLPYFENIGAFTLLTGINIRSAHMFSHIPIDLKLLLIIIFTIMYGSRQGIFSFMLSLISTIAVFIATSRDPVVLLYSTDFYMTLAYYVFVAFIIGYIKDNLVRENADKGETINILNEKMTFLTNLYHDMRAVRDELQSQIINSEDSFGKIFSILQELDTLKPEEVFAKAVSVLEKLMKTQGVAIYRFSETSKYARLMACSPNLNESIIKSINIEEYPEIISVMVKKDLYVSRELAEGRPIMAMPVFDHGEIVGSILIYKTEFERLTLSYQNYFRVITDLVSSTLSKAYAYDTAIESDKYIPGSNILRPAVFDEMLTSKRILKRIHKLEYVLLKVNLNGMAQKTASEKIIGIIRDTDFMGVDSASDFFIVLGNTNPREAGFVIGRLIRLGLDAEIINEVEKDE